MSEDKRKRYIVDRDDPDYEDAPLTRGGRRDFRAEKKRRAALTRKKRDRIIIIGIILVLAVLLLRFSAWFTVSDVRSVFGSSRGEDISKINFTYEPDSRYAINKGNLFIGSNEGVNIKRPGKGDAAAVTRTFSNIQLESGARYVIAYDYQGQSYFVISGDEIVKSDLVDGTLIGARLSRSGAYDIITKITGYRSVISAFGNDHTPIYRYYFAKDWVVDSHISPNNRKMATVYIDTEGDALAGGIAFFDFTKEEPVSRYIIDGEIPLAVEYKDNNLVSVLHSGGFLFFRSDGRKVGEYSFDGSVPYIADLTPSGYACAVIGSEDGASDGKLVIVNNSGVLRASYDLDTPVKKVLTNNSNVFLYTGDNRLLVIDWRGELKDTIKLDVNTRLILMDESNNIYALGLGRISKIET